MRYLLLLSTLLLTGCASMSLNDVYHQPAFEYRKTDVTGVSLSALSGTSTVNIENTNHYSIPVSSMNARLLLEGEDWMNLDNNSLSGLSADSTTSVTFNWQLTYDQLLGRMKNVYHQGEANFTLVLEPTLDVPILGLQTVSWQSDFTVPIPKLPTLSLTDWHVSSLSFSRISLTFDLDIHNPNMFSVNTQHWRAGLKQNNRSLVALDLNDTRLAANTSSQQSIEMSLSIADVGITLVNALSQGQWPSQFHLDWQGDWGSPDLGFKLPSLSGSLF